MVVRGRLAFDDQGRLVEIAEDAADPNNPQPSEIEPVEFEDLIAQTATIQDLDATQLVAALDANGFDISGVGALGASEAIIGGAPSDFHLEQIASDSATSVASLSATVSTPTKCLIFVSVFKGSNSGKVELRVNGNAVGNGNYQYVDESGSLVTGADGILLSDGGTGFEAVGGSITAHAVNRATFHNGTTIKEVSSFAQKGFQTETPNIQSFDIVSPDAMDSVAIDVYQIP